MSYVVTSMKTGWKQPMHLLRSGVMSVSGTPRKFLSKDAAREAAAEWAQHYADGGRPDYRVSVKKVS